MSTFNVPTREEVNAGNQAIFDNLNKALGFVPNLYATYAHSDTALENYLNFSNAKTSLSAKEKEVVNLAVSQVNDCIYCLSAHTAIGKMNGFTDEQILELRAGRASFDTKLNALAGLAKNITENRGKANQDVVNNFLNAGYSKGNLIDTIVLVGDKTISNYIHSTTQVPVDFPVAQPLETTEV
ncbi:putative peroxidase-related enzyme [Aquimarina sp. EL_43]|uniref:carboxymuconolactone decarboxylase family protein n=1 Tax=Aquimarina TaxID=290174 RepID=UPI00046F5023|nr:MULTISPECIES: carboxymuconolactone decarboxylase family protein [Aquimarina]MBG6128575.1 putative peroxidase-related enzyme [Aquimarina sp. EL_35]MBG6149638.1 putative peroxidase-related enzyme [Aquimarina sp. EL_32]MBG6167677.1 putative peroxidase-related enzyme [Aquimarina sp. EL_43]